LSSSADTYPPLLQVANRLQKAQKLLKQSKAKDYYKGTRAHLWLIFAWSWRTYFFPLTVIGVSRDADERTIKRAYRQAAKKAHPDKGGSEAKMAALNEAWEVLSKPELKQRYDSGDDPNDQESQRQAPFGHHGGSPFGQGSPFGGGFPGGGGHSFHFQWAG
jgi:DnaJ homolog subfamily C member 3